MHSAGAKKWVARGDKMGLQKKTLEIIEIAREVLAENKPMTVRQIYYQLVSRQVVENNKNRYQSVSDALVRARKTGAIPWTWIEDRLRRPRTVSMWEDLESFVSSALSQYRLDVWRSQGQYVEVWLEKDALSGIFEDVLEPYGVTLNVGRGYDGWSSIYQAAQRYKRLRSSAAILYFGDFDPSGEDMAQSLVGRLAELGAGVDLHKCALTLDDIRRYNLPPDFAKKTDSRAAKFIQKHGDISVELDALPSNVLRGRLKEEVEKYIDLAALAAVRARELADTERLRASLVGLRLN